MKKTTGSSISSAFELSESILVYIAGPFLIGFSSEFPKGIYHTTKCILAMFACYAFTSIAANDDNRPANGLTKSPEISTELFDPSIETGNYALINDTREDVLLSFIYPLGEYQIFLVT